MEQDETLGLSDQNAGLVWGIAFFGLLIFGPRPLDHWALNFGGIVVIAAGAYFTAVAVGRRLKLDVADNDRFGRGLAAALAGAAVVGAYDIATTNYHSECTKTIQTRDGRECIGDYMTAPGPDWFGCFALLILAAVLFRAAVRRQ